MKKLEKNVWVAKQGNKKITNRGRFEELEIGARKITNRGSFSDFKLRQKLSNRGKRDFKSGQGLQIDEEHSNK